MTDAYTRTYQQERLRILKAARDGRMRVNEHGRYIIDGERRPDRRIRERLMREQFITWPEWNDRTGRVKYLGADGEIAGLESLLGIS